MFWLTQVSKAATYSQGMSMHAPTATVQASLHIYVIVHMHRATWPETEFQHIYK